MKKYLFQFALGALLVVSGGTFAAVNSGLTLPSTGNVGDVLTAEYWNQVVDGVKELDSRTREIKTGVNGNTAIGDSATPGERPVEKLDIRGAVKIGNTTRSNTGTIRFDDTKSDFEGYTGTEWKSLTTGDGGSGGSCTTQSSNSTFSSGATSASCDAGTISYAAVEWEDTPGKYFSSLGLSVIPNGVTADIDCLGNACKIHLICCEGGAGTGSYNDELSQLSCNDGNSVAWDANIGEWQCSASGSGSGEWTASNNGTDIFRENGNVGIGTITPNAKLDVDGQDVNFYSNADANSLSIGRNSVERLDIYVNDAGVKLTSIQDEIVGDTYGYGSMEFEIDDDNTAGDTPASFTFGAKNNGELLKISSNGNVGIGVSNPKGLLDVEKTSSIPHANTNGYVRFFDNDETNEFNGEVSYNGGSDSKFSFVNVGEATGKTLFHTSSYDGSAGGTIMTLENSGNVGIGTTSPEEKLDVDGAVKIATTASACDATKYGTIKYESDNFYGCKSTGWVLLN